MARQQQQDDDVKGNDGPEVAAPAPDGAATLAETPMVAESDEQDAGPRGGGRTVQSRTPSDQDVTVALAHPMDPARAKALGLETEDALPPGTEITLHRNYARTLINSGYIAIDPEDIEAVQEALRVK